MDQEKNGGNIKCQEASFDWVNEYSAAVLDSKNGPYVIDAYLGGRLFWQLQAEQDKMGVLRDVLWIIKQPMVTEQNSGGPGLSFGPPY